MINQKRKILYFRSKKLLPWKLLFPCVLIILVVFLFPVLYSLAMSFNQVDISNQEWTFVGLQNFANLLKDSYFLKSVVITGKFTLFTVFFEMVMGTLMAVFLNKSFSGRGFVRGIMILPWALPTVVNALMWKWIFNANYGVLNALLTQIGIIDSYKAWLADPHSALYCMLFANIWKETPYVVLLVLAGLQSIPADMYESARVDGCSGVKAFFKITIPMIKHILLILIITKTIWSIQTYDLVAIMTRGGPANATQLISYYVQKMTFKFFDFGTGAAMSYVIMLITFILSILYIKTMSKDGEVI